MLSFRGKKDVDNFWATRGKREEDISEESVEEEEAANSGERKKTIPDITRAPSVKKVKKKDGRSPTIRAVDAVLAKHACDPQWHGGDSSAGGRPRSLCARTRAGLQPRARGNAGALPASHVVVVGVSLRHAHARERLWAPCRWPGRLACM